MIENQPVDVSLLSTSKPHNYMYALKRINHKTRANRTSLHNALDRENTVYPALCCGAQSFVDETTSSVLSSPPAHHHRRHTRRDASNEYFVLVGRLAQKMPMLAACTVALLVVLALLVPSTRAAGFLVNPNPMQPSTFV